MYKPILCIIQRSTVPHRVLPHFHGLLRSLLLQYQFHITINKHIIYVSFSYLHAPVHLLAVRKHAHGYPLGKCNTFPSFKHAALQGGHAEHAEDSALFACFGCEIA